MSLKGITRIDKDNRAIGLKERLDKYLEAGLISKEEYKATLEEYGSIPVGEKTNKDRLKKIAYIILCIILLISLVSGAVVFYNNAIEKAYNEGKNDGYSSGTRKGYKVGYAYYADIKDEYNFYHDYAVITTTTGKKYHRYGCYHIKNRSFYIFNIENAKARGYTKCLDCFESSKTVDDLIKKYTK